MTALRIDTAQEKHPEFQSSIEDPNFESNVMSVIEDIALSDSPMAALDAAIKDGAQPNTLRKNHSTTTQIIVSILDDVKTIKLSHHKSKSRVRNNPALEHAIYSLHQEIGLSPNTIRQILLQFDIDISVVKIIRTSDKIMRNGILPNWIYRTEIKFLDSLGGITNA